MSQNKPRNGMSDMRNLFFQFANSRNFIWGDIWSIFFTVFGFHQENMSNSIYILSSLATFFLPCWWYFFHLSWRLIDKVDLEKIKQNSWIFTATSLCQRKLREYIGLDIAKLAVAVQGNFALKDKMKWKKIWMIPTPSFNILFKLP